MRQNALKFVFAIVLIAVILAPTSALAQTSGQSEHEAKQRAVNNYVNKFECMPGWFEIDVAACSALFAYYALFVPTALILALVGNIFDILLFFTIDSASYSGLFGQFIEGGWKVLRDIVNMVFILILLSLGVKIILDLKANEAKKMIGTVVIIALLINFSLFFVRVIVDAGNILAHVFYSAIISKTQPSISPSSSLSKAKSVSSSLVEAWNPARIIFAFVDKNNQLELSVSGVSGQAVNFQIDKNPNASAGYFLIFALLGTILNVVTIWVFLMVCLLFLARTVGLWLIMVFAPIAFISYIVPKVEGFKTGFGHREWWIDLLKYTLLAPVFVFFLFLIVMFLTKTGIEKLIGEEGSTIQKLLAIIFPFMIVIAILLRAKQTATELAGKMGETILSAAKTAIGVAGGLAFGVAGLAGRAVVGRVSERALGGRAAATAGVEEEAVRRARLAELGIGGRAAERFAPTDLKPSEISPYGKRAEQVVTPPKEEERSAGERKDLGVKAIEDRLKEIAEQKTKVHEDLGKIPTVGFLRPSERAEQTRLINEKKKLDAEEKTLQGDLEIKKETEERKKEKETAPRSFAGTIKDMAARGGITGVIGRKAIKTLNWAYTSSHDPRNTWGVKQIEKYFGLNFGKPKGKGGLKAAQDAHTKAELEFAKHLEPSAVELFYLRRNSNILNDLKVQMKRFTAQNGKEIFEHDDKGKIKTDKEGRYVVRSDANAGLLNTYKNLDSQISEWQKKYDEEKNRTDAIKENRLNNYARVAESGKDMNFVINVATFGKFGSAQGQEAAAKIREAISKGGVKIENIYDTVARELKELKEQKEKKEKDKPAPKKDKGEDKKEKKGK